MMEVDSFSSSAPTPPAPSQPNPPSVQDLITRENQRWQAATKSIALMVRAFTETISAEAFQAQLARHLLGYRTDAQEQGRYLAGDVLFAAYQDSTSEHWAPGVKGAIQIFEILKPRVNKALAAGEFNRFTSGRSVCTNQLASFDDLKSPATPFRDMNLTVCHMATLKRLFDKEFHLKIEFPIQDARHPVWELGWDLSTGATSTLDYFIAMVGMQQLGMGV